MHRLLVLLLASLLASASLAREYPPAQGYRLLATSDSKPAFWVAPEAAEALGNSDLDFIDITDFQDADPTLAPKAASIPASPSHQSVVRPLLNQIDMDLYEENLEYLSTGFRNRYYTSQYGLDSANWIFSQVQAIAANRSDITVTKFAHTWLQPSVIARIEGTSTSADDIVILGAHQDSTSPGMPSGSAPGADDDGSGSMGILEILRVLAANNFRPQHPIEFHWYAAEEVGLLGSQAIAKDYQARGVPVRGMMQLDMIGYTRSSTVGIIIDHVDPDTIAFNRLLIDEYLEIGWTNSACGYGCSDHASWDRYGYRASFPFEAPMSGSNPYIHTTSDTMSRIDFDHAREFVKLGIAFAVELSYV